MERALSSLGLKPTKSHKDLSALSQKQYPADASQYNLLEDCGRGVSATVHRAIFIPTGEVVAVKKLNLEAVGANLDDIIHETQLMKQYNHPNILPLYTSFVHGQELWMVMPFIAGGSVLHIMKYNHSEGLEEIETATIMREVLKGLDYVHKHGGIHRDVKAGNILVDMSGAVKLADFGVAATMERGGSWGNDKVFRMTFVGTPCWMAPEVMEQTQGYDSSADIWSFGITMLELAHGHAPFAKFPPMKVLLMTLQNPPPTLDDKVGKKRFSKLMRDVVTQCLQKDPSKRPTAAQLMEHKFFKQARDEEYIAKHLMQGLPDLGERVNQIRTGKAATKAEDNDRNLNKSLEQYVQGVSAWNFDLAALKQQAAMEPDEEGEDAGKRWGLEPISEEAMGDPTLNRASTPGLPPSLTSVFDDAAAASFVSTIAAHPPPAAPSAGPARDSLATFSGNAALPPRPHITGFYSDPVGSRPHAHPSSASALHQEHSEVSSHPSVSISASPGHISPLQISREGSATGSSKVEIVTTPSGSRQRKMGRFNVSEGDDVPPLDPFLPAATSTTDRSSEDGGLSKDDKAKEGEAKPEGEPTEAKRRGRFLVREEEVQGKTGNMVRASSAASLIDTPRSATAAGGLANPFRQSSMNSSTPSAATLSPKLQELMEHSAAHTAALQKLITAVQESERTGKTHPLLSRSSSTKGASPLFEENAQLERVQQRMADLEAKVLALEEENLRLKAQLGLTTAVASPPVANSPAVASSCVSSPGLMSPTGPTPAPGVPALISELSLSVPAALGIARQSAPPHLPSGVHVAAAAAERLSVQPNNLRTDGA